MKSSVTTMRLLVIIVAAVSWIQGQEQPAPPVIPVVTTAAPTTLRTLDGIKTQTTGPHFGRVACDVAGNVYLRRYDFQKAKINTLYSEPIRKVRPDGSLDRIFDITLNMPEFLAKDFAISSDGDIYVVGWVNSQLQNIQYYLRHFAADGSLKSTTKLNVGWKTFFPYKVAVFGTGEILVTGLAGLHQSTPVTAIFDVNGNLVRNIYEPEDETSRLEAESQMPNSLNSTVSRGDIALGDDGNAYLIRASYPAVVFAISPSGEVVRKLKIDLGDSAWRPEAMKISGGQLAVFFRKARAAGGILHILDFKGALLSSHSLDARLPASFLACYVPPATFTFTGPDASANFIQFYRVKAN